MAAARIAVIAGWLCAALVLAWAAGVIASQGEGGAVPSHRLADGLGGLWLAQVLCLGLLFPPCVKLWRTGEAVLAMLAFVLFPLPLCAIAWLMGVASLETMARGTLLPAAASLAVAAAGMLPRHGRASGVLTVMLQAGFGFAVVLYAHRWLAWTGL